MAKSKIIKFPDKPDEEEIKYLNIEFGVEDTLNFLDVLETDTKNTIIAKDYIKNMKKVIKLCTNDEFNVIIKMKLKDIKRVQNDKLED